MTIATIYLKSCELQNSFKTFLCTHVCTPPRPRAHTHTHTSMHTHTRANTQIQVHVLARVHTFSRTLKLAGPEKHHAGAKALWCAFMPDARQHPHGQGGRT